MFKLTFCLAAERQEITSFEKSKLVTACWSAGRGRTRPPRIIQKHSSTDYASEFVIHKLLD